jgi:A/G-specific adenine glycosylase
VNWTPQQFTHRLLDWYTLHGRHHLPWQINPTPYRVWVSEVMLQQTQVATVIPYFERFCQRFPDVNSLASAPLDEVLHLWTGLGYYARARNLHRCAQIVAARDAGEFPLRIEALIQLPGIGRSTAGAILALACSQRQPILDGNAKRALARVFGIDGDPTSKIINAALWAQAEACTPNSEVAAYTQAIMDLGATVCTRSRPACAKCPMSDGCVAALQGRQAELPGKKRKAKRASRETTLLIARSGSNGSTAVLLERRPASGVWGGLWSPPQFQNVQDALQWCRQEIGDAEEPQLLPPIDHAFTHFDLRLNPLQVRCRPHSTVNEGNERLWYPLDAPPRIGLPQPIRELLARLRAACAA